MQANSTATGQYTGLFSLNLAHGQLKQIKRKLFRLGLPAHSKTKSSTGFQCFIVLMRQYFASSSVRKSHSIRGMKFDAHVPLNVARRGVGHVTEFGHLADGAEISSGEVVHA